MKNLEHKLLEKGWKKHEISKAKRMLEKAKKNKPRFLVVPRIIIILLIFAIAIEGNIAVSLFLVPFLIVLESSLLFLILLLIISLTMGIVFAALIQNTESLEKKHHAFFATIVPIAALINFYFIVVSSNKVIDQLAATKIHQDPFVISIIYTVAFILPYLYTLKNER